MNYPKTIIYNQSAIIVNLKEKPISFHEVIDNMRDSIVIIGTDSKFIYISPQFSKLLGGKKIEVGDSIFKIFPPKLVPIWKKEFQKAINDKEEYRGRLLETQVIDKHNNSIWVELSASNYYDNDGNFQGFIVSIRDISKRKEMERKLKKEKEKFKLLTENQKDVTMSISLEGRLLYCSPAVKKFGGYNPEEEIGEHIQKYISSASDSSKALNLIRESRIDKKQKVIEIFYKPKEDNPFPVEVTTSPVIVDHEVKKFHCIMRDITKRKKVEEKLKESRKELRRLNQILEKKVKARTKKLEKAKQKLEEKNKRLKKLDKMKNDFISMAAHELKTPLASIYGYIDYIFLAYEDKIEESMKKDLNIVERNVKRLRAYINQLLDVMKIEESELKLSKSPTNFVSLLYSCIEELNYLFKQKQQELDLELEENLILNIDSGRIFQVCSNLLSNSIKFTPQGGKISITAQMQGPNFIFKIKDTGRGLRKTEKDLIFKKFEKSELDIDSYSKGKGSGLGLFISKGIIEAHGGKLWVESEGLDKGSTFIFTLPLLK